MRSATQKAFSGSTVLHLLLIIILGFLTYSVALRTPFVFDDTATIPQNIHVKDVSNIPSLLAGSQGLFASRPVMLSTFALNYHFGGLDTTGYHVVNISLHILNAALLYFLILLTGRLTNHNGADIRLAAIASSLLFLLHPLQTEGVTYIISRSALLSTAFFLLGIMVYLKTVTSKDKKLIYLPILFLISLLGMGSRENFVAFPLILVVYDLLFISKMKPRETLKHWWALLPVFASLIYLAHLVANNTYVKATDLQDKGIPAADYILTQFKVFWSYLRLFVIPVNQSVYYDYRVVHSIRDFPVVLATLGYAGIWVIALASVKRRPVAAFSLLWYLLILMPVSFGVALLQLRLGDVIFEHRTYLPNLGLCVLAGAGIVRLSGIFVTHRVRAIAALLSVLCLISISLSISRNLVWRDNISLWSDVVAKAPSNARGYNNLAMAYGSSGMTDKAIENFKRAIKEDPDFALPRYNLGSLYGMLGKPDEAEKQLKETIRIKPDYSPAYNNLGNVYLLKGDLRAATEYFKLAVQYSPENYGFRRNLAMVYQRTGKTELALEQLRLAEELKSGGNIK